MRAHTCAFTWFALWDHGLIICSHADHAVCKGTRRASVKDLLLLQHMGGGQRLRRHGAQVVSERRATALPAEPCSAIRGSHLVGVPSCLTSPIPRVGTVQGPLFKAGHESSSSSQVRWGAYLYWDEVLTGRALSSKHSQLLILHGFHSPDRWVASFVCLHLLSCPSTSTQKGGADLVRGSPRIKVCVRPTPVS